jgi:hypothetical protein
VGRQIIEPQGRVGFLAEVVRPIGRLVGQCQFGVVLGAVRIKLDCLPVCLQGPLNNIRAMNIAGRTAAGVGFLIPVARLQPCGSGVRRPPQHHAIVLFKLLECHARGLGAPVLNSQFGQLPPRFGREGIGLGSSLQVLLSPRILPLQHFKLGLLQQVLAANHGMVGAQVTGGSQPSG